MNPCRQIINSAWGIFFSATWARFKPRFADLIQSISQITALIDNEAASINIFQMNEWRVKTLEESAIREKRWELEQKQVVLRWLETKGNDQELKREWLTDRAFDGTGHWITKNGKFRAWLARRHGNPVLWMYGKPGAGKCPSVTPHSGFETHSEKGKSVLSAQIINYLLSDRVDESCTSFATIFCPVTRLWPRSSGHFLPRLSNSRRSSPHSSTTSTW